MHNVHQTGLMTMENRQHNTTRRSALKTMGKTTAFVAPVVATFKLTELTAKASGTTTTKLRDEAGNPFE